MTWPLFRTILILPGTVVVAVPTLLLWLFAGTGMGADPATTAGVRLWAGFALALAGLALAIWTVRLFSGPGEGTPAPWDPPRRLVVLGPYRHVRNPMITSVLLMLAAESLVAGSWPVAAWGAAFFTANVIYFPLVEEKQLEKRFGDDYRRYKAHVPRWVPRWKPWIGP